MNLYTSKNQYNKSRGNFSIRNISVFAALFCICFIQISEFVLGEIDPNSDLTQRLLSASTYLMSMAVVLSAVGAFFLFIETRQTSIDETSFEIIYRQVHDRDLIETINRWRTIREKYDLDHKDQSLDPLTYDHLHESREEFHRALSNNRVTDVNFHDFDSILQLLNYHEAIAIGIKHNALNPEIIKDWWRTTIVRNFLDCFIFICQYRNRDGNDKLFEEFESLATSWMNDKEKKRLTKQLEMYEEIEKKRK